MDGIVMNEKNSDLLLMIFEFSTPEKEQRLVGSESGYFV
jgi:hypothetical protein